MVFHGLMTIHCTVIDLYTGDMHHRDIRCLDNLVWQRILNVTLFPQLFHMWITLCLLTCRQYRYFFDILPFQELKVTCQLVIDSWLSFNVFWASVCTSVSNNFWFNWYGHNIIKQFCYRFVICLFCDKDTWQCALFRLVWSWVQI